MPDARGVAAPEVWTNSQVIRRRGRSYLGRCAPYTAPWGREAKLFADEAQSAHDPRTRCDLRHSQIEMDSSMRSGARTTACEIRLRCVAVRTVKPKVRYFGS